MSTNKELDQTLAMAEVENKDEVKESNDILIIDHLYKSYGNKKNKHDVLIDLNLTVKKGEVFGFIGKNGIGKSTTIDCIVGLKEQDEGHIIVDGNRFKPYKSVRSETVVKGDGKFMSIAAASILAKTYRDDYMNNLDKEYPQYGWKKNKGYPTKAHRDAILKYGVTPYHRLSFTLVNDNPLGLDI